MTEEQIKEQMSRGFVRLVANRSGYKCKNDEHDHGVDITLAEVRASVSSLGAQRIAETGRHIDLQLKCTCDSSIIFGSSSLKFDLEAKTFNDLVRRQADPYAIPLVLVLFILPDDNTQWLTVSSAETVLRGRAFYWQPPSGTSETSNTSTIRIEIPLATAIDAGFVPKLYDEFYP